ncbi:MAG: UrcA family protein [Parvularculaceae bacterium]|nr:UrcA family protein [Parvularculaceae bacterium]
MKLSVIGIAALAVAVSAPASAETMKFRYNSYELQSDSSLQAVHVRLMKQALRACYPGARVPLRLLQVQKECAASLADDVVQKIGDQRLTALHGQATADIFRALPNN